MGDGKPRSKSGGKAQSLQQQQSEDLDLEELTGRSNTATPGPSEDDVQSKQLFHVDAPCCMPAACMIGKKHESNCVHAVSRSIGKLCGHDFDLAFCTGALAASAAENGSNCLQPVHLENSCL